MLLLSEEFPHEFVMHFGFAAGRICFQIVVRRQQISVTRRKQNLCYCQFAWGLSLPKVVWRFRWSRDPGSGYGARFWQSAISAIGDTKRCSHDELEVETCLQHASQPTGFHMVAMFLNCHRYRWYIREIPGFTRTRWTTGIQDGSSCGNW